MDDYFSPGLRGMATLGALIVAGCAGYDGSDLKPGVSTLPEVRVSMGEPAMAWKNPDGSQQLAYPRGPAGTQSFMVHLASDGKLQRIERVLEDAQFSRIRNGMHKDEVLRILGPSGTPWTEFYARRNELVWSWLYCNSHSAEDFFDVMFDDATGIVRSTGRRPHLVGPDGIQPKCGRSQAP
jgi:hypothetical protein